MIYDSNRALLPGSIVCSKYTTFDGEERVGLFLVLYDEQSDNSIVDNKNVMAIKISTKNTCASNYSVNVDRNLNPFLNDDCIACCSKVHTLHKADQIYKLLGIVHIATFHRVFRTFMRFNNAVQSQLIANI